MLRLVHNMHYGITPGYSVSDMKHLSSCDVTLLQVVIYVLIYYTWRTRKSYYIGVMHSTEMVI